MEKNHYLYKITNKLNGKIYIGVRTLRTKTEVYYGGGKRIKAAIKKYGIDNFKKEILEYFDSRELMYLREKEIVNEEFLQRKDVYNLIPGGVMSTRKGNIPWNKGKKGIYSKEHIRKISETSKRPCSEETKKKLREAALLQWERQKRGV